MFGPSHIRNKTLKETPSPVFIECINNNAQKLGVYKELLPCKLRRHFSTTSNHHTTAVSSSPQSHPPYSTALSLDFKMFDIEHRGTNVVLPAVSLSERWGKPPSSNASLHERSLQIPTPAQAALLNCETSRIYLRSFPFKVECRPDGSSCIQVQCTVALCGAVFSSRIAFRSHLRTHTAIIRRACPFEAKSFECRKVISAGSRIRHMMTHFPTIEQCSFCNKTFNRKSVLDNHIRRKHQDETTTIIVELA